MYFIIGIIAYIYSWLNFLFITTVRTEHRYYNTAIILDRNIGQVHCGSCLC